jgi:ABC-type Fe3+/spermidine/putrescine transport system ATPase subunit
MNAIDPAKKRDEKAQSATPGIDVRTLAVRYGDVTAVHDVSFSVARGELVTLLGPSGCGKTTTLRSIAGLEQPHAGSIVLGGRTVYDGAARSIVPTEKRGVSMVFQSYAIWPHMTVAQNVAYGLRVRSLPRDAIAAAVDEALGLVQMRPFADRMATRLSGGQQQRIAVARAIAFHPEVVLFDEPLSNLDAKLREEMRVEIRELQQRLSITALYVTHDQEEALAISDRVIVMQGGRIEQEGPPEFLYNQPASRFVADFMGSANLIEGRLRRRLPHEGRRRDRAAQRPAAARRRDDAGAALGLCRAVTREARRTHGKHARRLDSPSHVPRRLHPVHGRLPCRPPGGPPPAHRSARRRHGRHARLRAGACVAAVMRSNAAGGSVPLATAASAASNSATVAIPISVVAMPALPVAKRTAASGIVAAYP